MTIDKVVLPDPILIDADTEAGKSGLAGAVNVQRSSAPIASKTTITAIGMRASVDSRGANATPARLWEVPQCRGQQLPSL
jgi:hypothetical protein